MNHLTHSARIGGAIVAALAMFLFFAPPTYAATIAFDTEVQSAQTPSANIALTMTNTGSTDLIFVGCPNQNTGGIAGANINGSPMTLVDSQLARDGVTTVRLYYFVATTTVNKLSITRSTTTNQWTCFMTSYSGARISSIPDASTKGTTSTNTMTGTVTTVADNDWGVFVAYDGNGGMGASTGSTLRGSIVASAYGMFDTNSALTPPGSHSMSVTDAGSGTSAGFVMAAFAPAVTSTASPKPWQLFAF